MQGTPLAHTFPHTPQLLGSDWRFEQTPLQQIWPKAHLLVHEPHLSNKIPVSQQAELPKTSLQHRGFLKNGNFCLHWSEVPVPQRLMGNNWFRCLRPLTGSPSSKLDKNRPRPAALARGAASASSRRSSCSTCAAAPDILVAATIDIATRSGSASFRVVLQLCCNGAMAGSRTRLCSLLIRISHTDSTNCFEFKASTTTESLLALHTRAGDVDAVVKYLIFEHLYTRNLPAWLGSTSLQYALACLAPVGEMSRRCAKAAAWLTSIYVDSDVEFNTLVGTCILREIELEVPCCGKLHWVRRWLHRFSDTGTYYC